MLNLIEIKKAIVEVERFMQRAEQASAGVSDHETEYYVYMLKRTSIDAERALKHLRRALEAGRAIKDAEPVAVPQPEQIHASQAVE